MLRVRVALSGTGINGPGLTTFYFDGSTDIEAQSAASAAHSFFNSLAAHIHQTVSWAVEPEVAVIAPTTGALQGVFAITPAGGSGTTGFELLPRANQGLVRWHTAGFVNNHRVQGATFIPGPTEGETTDGKPIAAYTDALDLAADNLIASAGNVLGVWARPFTPVPPATTPPARLGSFHPVTSSSVPVRYSILRSRRD